LKFQAIKEEMSAPQLTTLIASSQVHMAACEIMSTDHLSKHKHLLKRCLRTYGCCLLEITKVNVHKPLKSDTQTDSTFLCTAMTKLKQRLGSTKGGNASHRNA
jgi:hypothetical protein